MFVTDVAKVLDLTTNPLRYYLDHCFGNPRSDGLSVHDTGVWVVDEDKSPGEELPPPGIYHIKPTPVQVLGYESSVHWDVEMLICIRPPEYRPADLQHEGTIGPKDQLIDILAYDFHRV